MLSVSECLTDVALAFICVCDNDNVKWPWCWEIHTEVGSSKWPCRLQSIFQMGLSKSDKLDRC